MPDTATSKKERKTRTAAGGTAALATASVSQADIARLAYEYYCARGGQGGDALEDWLRAERELTSTPPGVPVRRQRKPKSIN